MPPFLPVVSLLVVLAGAPLVCASGQHARPGSIDVRHFSIEQGLSDRQVNGFGADGQGFVWIATENGLDRFDGYGFLNYNTQPRNTHKIGQNKVFGVLPDRAGGLLVGYNIPVLARLDRLDPRTGQIAPVVSRAGDGLEWGFHQAFTAENGDLFFYSVQNDRVRIFRFDEATGRFPTVWERHFSGISDKGFHAFLRAADGSYWFSVSLPGPGALSLLHTDSTGRLLHRFGAADFGLPAHTASGAVALTEAPDGDAIWFSVLGYGAFIVRPTDRVPVHRHHGLPRAGCLFARDRQHNVLAYHPQPPSVGGHARLATRTGQLLDYSWIFRHQAVIREVYSHDFAVGLLAGSGDGFNAYRLHAAHFERWLYRDIGNAPYGLRIRGMARGGDRRLFVATEYDGLYEFDLHTGQTTRPGARGGALALLDSIKWPKNILTRGDSVLWIGQARGVLKYAVQQGAVAFFPTYGDTLKFGYPEIWGIAWGKPGRLWVVIGDGRLLDMDAATGAFTEYRDRDGSAPLDNTQPRFLLAGQDGALWVGTELAGLFRIDPERRISRHYAADPDQPAGLANHHITCIYEDAAGRLWLGTMGSGVQVFDPRRERVVATYGTEHGLGNTKVVGILPDDAGNYWVSTFNGLAYLDTRSQAFYNYTAADGLSHDEFNRFSYYFDREDHRFYFGGMNGVNSFREHDLQPAPTELPVLVSQLTLTGPGPASRVLTEGLIDGATIAIEPGTLDLDFQLALAGSLYAADNRFAWRLDGVDTAWHFSGVSHTLHFDRLAPGTYRLRVRGGDYRGNWSTRETVLTLDVQAAWYEARWLHLLLAGFVLAGPAYWYYRRRAVVVPPAVLPKFQEVKKTRTVSAPKANARVADRQTPAVAAVPDAAADEEWLLNIHEVAARHLGDPDFGGEELARAVYLSLSQLNRRLNAAVGKSSVRFLHDVRLQRAQSLLRETTMPVTEVAWAVGFRDPSYFTRIFTREFGMSPKEWREGGVV